MRLFFAALSATLLTINPANAESKVLFDVQEHCQSRETTQGVRYIPPCTLPDREYTFSLPENNNTVKSPSLEVNFQCQSMRPLSFQYQLSRDGNIVSTGNLAGTRDSDERSSFSLNSLAADYTFKLIKMEGGSGFQAIKPGCQLIATTVDNEIKIEQLAEQSKINIALLESTTRALAKKNTHFFKFELINNKYWLITLEQLLTSESSTTIAIVNNAVKQFEKALALCRTSYCYNSSAKEVETINHNSEQYLLATKQHLDDLLEAYDFGNEKITDEITAWLQLRTLINKALFPNEENSD